MSNTLDANKTISAFFDVIQDDLQTTAAGFFLDATIEEQLLMTTAINDMIGVMQRYLTFNTLPFNRCPRPDQKLFMQILKRAENYDL